MASRLDWTKEILFENGTLCFKIPFEWKERYKPSEHHGMFYEDTPTSGTFRLYLNAIKSENTLTKEDVTKRLDAIKQTDKITFLENGNALKQYIAKGDAKGKPLTILYWTLAHIAEPNLMYLVNFSYTIFSEFEKEEWFINEAKFLTEQIKAARFDKKSKYEIATNLKYELIFGNEYWERFNVQWQRATEFISWYSEEFAEITTLYPSYIKDIAKGINIVYNKIHEGRIKFPKAEFKEAKDAIYIMPIAFAEFLKKQHGWDWYYFIEGEDKHLGFFIVSPNRKMAINPWQLVSFERWAERKKYVDELVEIILSGKLESLCTETFRFYEPWNATNSNTFVSVDNLYLIKLPSHWKVNSDDRFRVFSEQDGLEMSITNYTKTIQEAGVINADFFKGMKLDLYKRYEQEGGYIPLTEHEVTDQYITKTFKVGNENHYCYTTSYIVGNKVILIDIFLYQNENYKTANIQLIKDMINTIAPRVA